MVSYLLPEARDYCCERGSSLHACYLDAQSPSTKFGSTGWFTNFTNLVSVESYSELSLSHSKIAPVAYYHVDLSRNPSRFNRAPGRAANVHHSFYIVYINDLLNELTTSPYGFKIGDQSLCSPTQADDVVLLSLSRRGLNELARSATHTLTSGVSLTTLSNVPLLPWAENDPKQYPPA
ncbi:hypothetical protein DPMN_038451 [Dreissena polymorpha]|uniref:Uncharacterized protein n=1 Tax=Dreissena polymorpha TaxID=45954 RepID=A0A9D4RQ93_DREPO|nr:hypothetical protein DPMN_038451 [Dreissena polymorpha]